MQLLGSFCRVIPFLFNSRYRYPALLRRILSADIVFCWFALPYAAVAASAARLLKRKSIVVAGGWDVTGIREIGYGRLLTRAGYRSARRALSYADRVLAFSDWSAGLIYAAAARASVRRVFLGLDPSLHQPSAKGDLVVTIANVTRENVIRKGLRSFVLAARDLPEVRFVLVGKHVDGAAEDLQTVATSNVEMPGWVPDLELRALLGRAKVYVQASYTEGFGMALVEAMASGCVPVVTERGAIPEVVGNAGLYVEYGNVASLVEGIRKALGSDLGVRARARVAERFTDDQRRDALFQVVQELADSARGSGRGIPKPHKPGLSEKGHGD